MQAGQGFDVAAVKGIVLDLVQDPTLGPALGFFVALQAACVVALAVALWAQQGHSEAAAPGDKAPKQAAAATADQVAALIAGRRSIFPRDFTGARHPQPFATFLSACGSQRTGALPCPCPHPGPPPVLRLQVPRCPAPPLKPCWRPPTGPPTTS